VRPAPAESPQGRKAARVGGCSGATQVAYPLFFCKKKSGERLKKSFAESKINSLLCAAEIEKQTFLKLFKTKY